MKYATARNYALSLADTSEAPHFKFNSFRVNGKIFATVPPEETHLHLFVDEAAREQALALHPECIEKLFWGQKVCGLRLALASAPPSLVKQLLHAAWSNKAGGRKTVHT